MCCFFFWFKVDICFGGLGKGFCLCFLFYFIDEVDGVLLGGFCIVGFFWEGRRLRGVFDREL